MTMTDFYWAHLSDHSLYDAAATRCLHGKAGRFVGCRVEQRKQTPLGTGSHRNAAATTAQVTTEAVGCIWQNRNFTAQVLLL